MQNVSFDGSPVQFRLDSPWLLCFDPICLDWIRDQLASWPANDAFDVGHLLERVNCQDSAMSCYQIVDFQPGVYSLDPRDIRKFGDEDEELDYEGGEEDEVVAVDVAASYPFVGVDSATLIFADFAQIGKLAELLSWEQYDHALQDDTVFDAISAGIGGPYFAVIQGGCMDRMEFDGDGTYTIKAGAVKRIET